MLSLIYFRIAIIGIDIDRASKVVDLTRLEAEALPINSIALAK
jgi:hypothetical protein